MTISNTFTGITGGNIDGTPIGTGSPNTGNFTTVSAVTEYVSTLLQPVAIVSAAGTTQGAATILTGVINRLQGVADGTTTGFAIPANKAGFVQYVLNETAVSANLWPPTGGTINAGAANTVFALAAKTSYMIFHVNTSAYGVK